MRTILIAEPNSLVAEDIAEIVLRRWSRSCPAVVTTAAQGIAAVRDGAVFNAADLRFSASDTMRAQLLALLVAAGTKLVMIDDIAAPSLAGHEEGARLPDAQYIAKPFTTNEMLNTLERALSREEKTPAPAKPRRS